MARGRKTKAQSNAASLQAALAFCSVAYREIGDAYQTHVVLHGKQLHAFDGILAAGHPIADELSAAPHGARLRQALDRSGSLSLALSEGHLAVSCGQFRARIPCVPLTDLQPFGPDPVQLTEGVGRLPEAFGAVAHLAANSGTTVVESSVLLAPYVLTATNLKLIMQYWHGIALPEPMAVPRPFALAVMKAGLAVVGIGWSERTLTAHFDNGAWLRTQLYAEPWPSIDSALADMPTGGDPLPEGFFAACEAVLPFADPEISRVVVLPGMVTSDGAEHECAGLPDISPHPVLSGKLLKHIANRVTHVDWTTGKRAVHFFGENMRVAMARYEPKEAA